MSEILWITLFIAICLVIVMVAKNRDLVIVLKAMQNTGVRGELFSVSLPDGRVAIAGVVMSAEEARRFHCEFREGYQVIMETVGNGRIDDQTVEVFRRKPRSR